MKSLIALGILGAGIGAGILMKNRYMWHNAAYQAELARLQEKAQAIPQSPNESEGEQVASIIGEQTTRLTQWEKLPLYQRVLVPPPSIEEEETDSIESSPSVEQDDDDDAESDETF